RAQTQEAERSGKLVVEAKNTSFAYGPKTIVRDLNTTIMRGDRVGFIGSNGSGKTTLLRLLLGTLPPDTGDVRLGTKLEIAYFDQLREQLDPDQTVFDSIADGADFIEVGGDRKHVTGYLQDFLFPPDRARTPVRALSGGERNRLLLARLFTRSFNVLALDEPTNDLDIETLELLEELLLEFSGTLLVVSHDREFLDHVVTSTLVMEGNGRVGEYAGGYNDWVRQRRVAAPARDTLNANAGRRTNKGTNKETNPNSNTGAVDTSPPQRQRNERRKMPFRERRELEALPVRIEELERERSALYASLADPALHRDGVAASEASKRLCTLDMEIEHATARWVELESLLEECER
ncbi:MAG: ATP-binding cassette domain-containing protein, partial [Gemmatimonadaceae bacterium]